MSVIDELAALGLALPETAAPLGLYRPALRDGAHVYVSGQLAFRDGELLYPGVLGAGVSVAQGQEAARAACLNALAAAQGAVDSLDGLRVLRLVGYVAATPDFADHPAVVNGASELLRDVFGEERGVGVRLALGVASLPARSPVEVELLFTVD